jgi:NAD(P)-dependent dehydrogenase (short-subunit alcohol dehydrogenase family)
VTATNLDSVFNTTKQVCLGVVERGWGRIISVSSVNGQKDAFGQTSTLPPKPACTPLPKPWPRK